MALLSAFFHDDLRAQQNKWIRSPTLVDFNTRTTAAQSWLPTVGYTVENTALDANGNVLFYIRDKSVILPSGTVAGSLPNVQGSFCGNPGNLYTGILYEIAIVPVPGTCNRFYILWCAQKGVCGTALCATTITVNANGTLTIGSGQLVDEAAGASSALAVARSNGTDSRSLYWVGGLKGLVNYSISSGGISSGTTLYGYNSAGSFEGVEAEVDKNNGYVIWVDKQGEVYSASVTASSDNLRHYVLPTKRSAWGIEFDDTEKGFYISTTQYLGGTASGIYHYPDLTDLSTNTLVSSTGDYEKTFIEKAKDNNFYAVNKNGILGKFTGNGPATSAFSSLQVYSAGSIFNAGDHYKLPDQIDGENYDYFFGVSPYNLTGMAINGTPLVDAILPPPPAFYNCNPISLATTWTGSAASYTIYIYSVDPATGNQLTGSQYLNFSTSGTGNVPTPIDLRTIAGNTNLFGNYLGQTFAIRIRGVNSCGDSQDFLLCYFRVLGPPATAMINLQVNPGNGIPCNASHSIASPCAASIYSASLNMGNSSGNVTF